MARYSMVDVAKIWARNGGATGRYALIATVAIAFAESGGDSLARSPSNDYGLWQINGIHFGDGIIDAGNWANVDVNAREAIKLSANGLNWAAWCTAWANPGPNCGHGFLGFPQAGSPAGMRVDQVSAALGSMAGTPAGPSGDWSAPVGNASVSHAWASMQSYAAHGAPTHYRSIHAAGYAFWRLAR